MDLFTPYNAHGSLLLMLLLILRCLSTPIVGSYSYVLEILGQFGRPRVSECLLMLDYFLIVQLLLLLLQIPLYRLYVQDAR